MSSFIKILVFSEDSSTTDGIVNFSNAHPEFNMQVDTCPLNTELQEIFTRYVPHIIFVDFSTPDPEIHERIFHRLEKMSEALPLIGIFQEGQSEFALQCFKKGLKDFIELPFKDTELIQVVERFRKKINTQKVTKLGKLITFFSFKGGIGNTFTTVNTAVALAKKTNKRILLWDMSLQASDIPFFLDYQPEYTLSQILDNLDQADESYLNAVLPTHSSGVSLLAAPQKIEEVDRLKSASIDQLTDILLENFDYILVDGGYTLTESLMSIIDKSSFLCVTSTLELISLKSAFRVLEVLEQLNFPFEKTKVIVNRYSQKQESIRIERAKKILRYDLAHFVPNDYMTASQSVNLGQPVNEASPKSGLALNFLELANKIEANFDESLLEKKNEEKKDPFKALTALFKKKVSSDVAE